MTLDCCRHHRPDCRPVGHVGRNRVGDGSGGTDGLHRLARVLVGEVVDEHAGAVLGERKRDAAADSAAGARHEHDPVLELGVRRHQK